MRRKTLELLPDMGADRIGRTPRVTRAPVMITAVLGVAAAIKPHLAQPRRSHRHPPPARDFDEKLSRPYAAFWSFSSSAFHSPRAARPFMRAR